MTKYFAQDTPRAGLERMMMSVPGFQRRGGGTMILSRFRYKPEDVACRYCLHYRRRSCQIPICPYIAERLKSGAIGYHWYLPGGQLLRHQGDRTYANPGVDSRPSPRGRGEGQKVQRGQRKETRYGSRKEKGPRIRHSKGSTHLAPRNSEVDPLQRTCASTDIPSERNS